jgi:aromatic ring-opening dioxygenase catalytic subunit (LigB family)
LLSNPTMTNLSAVLYIPHGGGPLPLLGEPGHASLVEFLQRCGASLPRPKAVLVISAHWEEPVPTVLSAAQPELYYDYYGFPPESYRIRYPAPGSPAVADRVIRLLRERGLSAESNAGRGFDHGLFVPLKLLYPDADIPCLQLSLRDSLDPEEHIAIGKALAPLREEGVMFLGSGSSFHNMNAFRHPDQAQSRAMCEAFDGWLGETCCGAPLDQAETRLRDWRAAPHALYAHPREEHLLPLHVCFGAAAAGGRHAERVFHGDVMGYTLSAFLWR